MTLRGDEHWSEPTTGRNCIAANWGDFRLPVR
jgi:hypothetical protein